MHRSLPVALVQAIDGGHQAPAALLQLFGEGHQQMVLEGVLSHQLLHQHPGLLQGFVGVKELLRQG